MTLTSQIDSLLSDRFGFSELLPGQREVMEHLLEGRSAAAVFPTGGGKSLCYQLPALALDGLTLVVSPLIALMKDQIDGLQSRGIAAARLDSSLTADEYREVAEGVRRGAVKLLYVAPERFNNERFRSILARTSVALLAIDEAHCISEWGHNFRPDYLKLARFGREFGAERVLALTATATPPVLADICAGMEIDPQCAVRTPFYRPNLTLLSTSAHGVDRDALLLQRIRDREPGPTIVYVTQQKTAEHVAEKLAAAGVAAQPYHAGLKSDRRSQIQDEFMNSDSAVVVATIAFGMGVDKSNIRYVYHYNLPKSLENYSQEIGRAGRDGQPATCETFANLADLRTLENFVYGDTPSKSAVRQLVGEVAEADDAFEVSLFDLAFRCDIRTLVVRTLLTYLELDRILESGTPRYAAYRFKPRMPSQQILSHFQGERQEFLRRILQQSRKAKTWFDLDVDQAARTLQAPRDRIVRALDYLSERQMLEVESSGVRHPFRRLQPIHDPVELADRLSQRMLEREQKEVERLEDVLRLLTLPNCQSDALCRHFGEQLDGPCGHCSFCLEGRPLELAAPAKAECDGQIWSDAAVLRKKHPETLRDPRAVARLLCGISSPQASRAKLQREPLFGRAAESSFPDVLRHVESSME